MVFNTELWSKRILYARRERQMSLREFGDFVGVSHMNISYWESGLSRPKVDCFLEMCRKLNFDPMEFYDG